MTKVTDLQAKWKQDPAYVEEYEALANEYAALDLALNPWTNGLYARAAIVLGLIVLSILSVAL